jgi:hypothetical protein
MDWQLFAVAAAVAVALAYVTRRTLRTWRGRGSACGGCKCGDKVPARGLIGVEELTARLREP